MSKLMVAVVSTFVVAMVVVLVNFHHTLTKVRRELQRQDGVQRALVVRQNCLLLKAQIESYRREQGQYPDQLWIRHAGTGRQYIFGTRLINPFTGEDEPQAEWRLKPGAINYDHGGGTSIPVIVGLGDREQPLVILWLN